jgi:UDPglucose 6-dehydrogenase
MNIAVAGLGYVGLSLSLVLSLKNHVIAFDVVSAKVDQVNQKVSPIQDKEIRNTFRPRSSI